nr:hypothetical protein pmam_13 [Pithovirus mammoth]
MKVLNETTPSKKTKMEEKDGLEKLTPGTELEKPSSQTVIGFHGFSSVGGSHISKIRDANWEEKKPIRAGVIVYKIYQGQLLFCMGVDRKTRELTDFGGGISYRKDKTLVKGALREFNEESLGVFGSFEEEKVLDGVVAYNDYMAILFLHLDCDIEEVTDRFVKRFRAERSAEVSSLAWMTVERFRSTLFDQTGNLVYERVSELLRPVFSELIDNL